MPSKTKYNRRPIENKYCEGKLKSTLKRESKVPEIAWVEGMSGGKISVVQAGELEGSMT